MPPDPLVVERLCAGHLTAAQVRPEDRDAAIRHLTAQGLTPTEVGTRLGTTATVVRGVLRRPARKGTQ